MSRRKDSLDDLRAAILSALEDVLTPDQKPDEVADHIVSKIQTAFGAERIYIRKTGREERRHTVLAAWQQGSTPQEIAEQHDIPLRTVYHIICNRHRSDRDSGLGSDEWVL